MAEKEAPKGGTHKNIAVMAIIWITFIVVVFSNPAIQKYFKNIFTGSKYGYYGDVIFLSPSKNVFTNGKVYYDKKPDVYDIVMSPFNKNHFLAATNYGLFLSSDNGLNWYHFDLPKTIGTEIPIYRIFTNPQSQEISILILDGENGIIYTTSDNFYSLKKSFEINKKEAVQIIKDRTISTIISMGSGKFILGTTK